MIGAIVNLIAVLITYVLVGWLNDFNKESMLVAFALIIMYDLCLIKDKIEELKK
jgi:hypothetical protein